MAVDLSKNTAREKSKDGMMQRVAIIVMCIVVGTTVGCVSNRVSQKFPMVNKAVRTHYVPTKLYRMNAVMVPVSQASASLRSVIADARDLDSQGGAIVGAFMLNSPQALAEATGIPITQADLDDNNIGPPTFAGGEVIVLMRGSGRIFIPSYLVHETAAGSIAVLPGDSIISIPASVFVSPGRNGDSSSALFRGRFTLTSEHFADRVLPLSGQVVVNAVDFPNWAINQKSWDLPPKLDPNLPRPNTVVVTREASDGFIETSILPYDITGIFNIRDNDTFATEFVNSRKYTTLPIQDRDIIELTRLEQVPIIAAGLATPVTPRMPATENASLPRHCSSKPLRRM